jgi:AcrR family transcriptional regulator
MAESSPELVPRPVLNRKLVVRAAIQVIEREGAKALSMRAVANELGAGVMSLYNHVPNKDALIGAIAEYVMDQLEIPGDIASGDGADDWKVAARALVRAFRNAAHDYPRSMSIVLTHKIDFPVGYRATERALQIADHAGFDGKTCVNIMRALVTYALGAQVREAGKARMLQDSPNGSTAPPPELDPAEYPHVVALSTELLTHDPDAEFEFGLDLLISAIDQLPRRSS